MLAAVSFVGGDGCSTLGLYNAMRKLLQDSEFPFTPKVAIVQVESSMDGVSS